MLPRDRDQDRREGKYGHTKILSLSVLLQILDIHAQVPRPIVFQYTRARIETTQSAI